MEIELISTENVGPSSPTPPHLRTYKLSSLDQIFHHFYVPMILFYLNDPNTNLNDVIFTRVEHLKQSLSETLTSFYPFAGRLKDDLSVDCNDEGIYFAKARVNCSLETLLHKPNHQLINRLAPQNFNPVESTSGSYVFAIQVNIFDCGGIALSTSSSHKVIDGNSYYAFLKAWAFKMNGSSSSIVKEPNFVASSLFPQSPFLSNTKWPRPLINKQTRFTSRRFLFDAVALSSLKTKIASSLTKRPTNVEAISALIWKCASNAALKAGSISNTTPHTLSIFVNLRRKKSPPLTDQSIGNLLWRPFAQCIPGSDNMLEVHEMVRLIRESLSKINGDFVDEIKGEEGVSRISQYVKEYCELYPKVDWLNLTSICNSGIYEVDFGWGKPIWFYYVCSTPVVALIDTRSGDGIEAFVCLREQDMAIFERDDDIRAFTSLNPSPLELFIVFYANAPADFSNRLEESFRLVLNHDCMYPLAGRIKDMYLIDCSDQGVLYVKVRVNEEFANVVRNPKNDAYSQLFPQQVWTNPCDRVLLAIQVSEFVNGGIAISMRCSHGLIDGAALAFFLKNWADIAQSESQGKKYNLGNGFVVDCTDIFPPREVIYVVKNPPRMEGMICENTKGNIFTFNASNIATIKEKSSKKGERQATRFEAMSAFLWAAVIAARKNSGRSLRMHINCTAINLCGRIVPNLPQHCLGNLSHVALAVCSATEGEGGSMDLSVLIEKIHNSISKVTHEEMVKQHAGEECVKNLIKQLERTSIVDDGIGLLVTSSFCRFPFYEADFGWGKPSWVGFDAVGDNIIRILDSENGDGIEVWMRLREEEMAILEQDLEFLSYVSSIQSL